MLRTLSPRALPLALLALSGCASTLRAGRPDPIPDESFLVSETASDRCMHGVPGPNSPYREPLPGAEEDPARRAYVEALDPTVRRTAVAAGLEPLLAHVLEVRARGADPHDPALLSMHLELAQRIASLETQLTAIEFECDCVRNLLYVELGEYEESETDRQLAYTIVSLVVGAATSLTAAVWDLANSSTTTPVAEEAPLVIGIGGALAGTGLGAAVLVRQPREVTYVHEHNLLEPVLDGQDPDLLYPTFVFRMLTMPSVGGGPSPRDRLVATWEDELGEAVSRDRRPLASEIVFRDGGVYDPSLLSAHQSMLQELGAELDAMARDIDLLARAVALALEMDFDATDDD